MIEMFSQQLLTLSLSPTALPTIVELPMPRRTQRETHLYWYVHSLLFLIHWFVGRKMGNFFFLERAGESPTVQSSMVQGSHNWRSAAWYSVTQESTPVLCRILLGCPQGVWDWWLEVRVNWTSVWPAASFPSHVFIPLSMAKPPCQASPASSFDTYSL